MPRRKRDLLFNDGRAQLDQPGFERPAVRKPRWPGLAQLAAMAERLLADVVVPVWQRDSSRWPQHYGFPGGDYDRGPARRRENFDLAGASARRAIVRKTSKTVFLCRPRLV